MKIDLNKTINSIEKSYYINPNAFFINVNNCFPNKLCIQGLNHDDLLCSLITRYHLTQKDYYIVELFDSERKRELRSTYIYLKKGLNVFLNPGLHFSEKQTEILYSHEIPNDELVELKNFCYQFYQSEPEKGSKYMGIIYQANSEFRIKYFKIEDSETNWDENYNDDFSAFANHTINLLNSKKPQGLYLLYGEPGCGKTNFIRSLTDKTKHKLIYLPADLCNLLTEPGFINFVIENLKNKILVIEDAETVLEDRKGGNKASIANILNITDGLLGDCLKTPIICSFNTSIHQIDKALLRKGRLKASYEFKPLNPIKATALSAKLGFNMVYAEPATLAEIYNEGSIGLTFSSKNKIGYY